MIVSLAEFSKAFYNINRFASDFTQNNRMLINIASDLMSLCYSSGNRNIIEKLEYEAEDGDRAGQFIVSIEDIASILSICSTSSTIFIDNITIRLEEPDKFRVTADKYIKFSDGEEIQKKNCSRIDRTVKYYESSDIKNSILTRFDYTTIFSEFNDPDEADEWKITGMEESKDTNNDLVNILKRLYIDDQTTCYVSGGNKAAFSIPTAGLTFAPIEKELHNGFSVSGRFSRCLSDTLSLLGTKDDTVFVKVVDKRYCYMITRDERAGIMFELQPGSRLELRSMERYRNTEYKDYELVFNREVITDIVNQSIRLNKEDTTEFSFESLDDEVVLIIKRGDASSNSTLSVSAAGYKQQNEKEITDLKFRVNLKYMQTLLKNCSDYYIRMNIAVLGNDLLIRMDDCHQKVNEAGEVTVASALSQYTTAMI